MFSYARPTMFNILLVMSDASCTVLYNTLAMFCFLKKYSTHTVIIDLQGYIEALHVQVFCISCL